MGNNAGEDRMKIDQETKNQIIEILMAWYQIPGEFLIGGIVALGIGNSMLSFTKLGLILIILGYFLIILEIVAPFIVGLQLYQKAIKNITKFFK